MTLKSRLAGLVTILVLFAMAPSLFAQVQISILPDVNPGEISTNRNGYAAIPGTQGSGTLVLGSLLATSGLGTTVLRLTYPGPITSVPGGALNCTTGYSSSSTSAGTLYACGNSTSSSGVPTADPITITGAAGVFQNVGLPLLNTGRNAIEIFLPSSGVASNSSSGSFRLTGVRFDVNGLSGAQTVTASLNTSVNNYVLGTPSSGTVISSISNGIANLAIGAAGGSATVPGTASILNSGSIGKSSGSFVLTEGCASCWRAQPQETSNGKNIENGNGTQIRLTFNNIPSGVTLNLSTNVGSQTKTFPLLSSTTVNSGSNTAVIDFDPAANKGGGGTDLSKVETLEIDYSVVPLSSTAAAAVKGVTTPISVTATHFPIGTGQDTNGLGTTAGGYPTFSELDIGPLTIVNIVSANTIMLMPLIEVTGPYDTGISIANTTSDPFGGAGNGGATPGFGTITFSFYPTNTTGSTSFTAAPLTLTTSATNRPGIGLSSDGTLASGATWTVLASQLLALAGQPAGQSFIGYAFISANFLDAHGLAYISDFKTFSGAASVLILPPPSSQARGTSGFEGLHF